MCSTCTGGPPLALVRGESRASTSDITLGGDSPCESDDYFFEGFESGAPQWIVTGEINHEVGILWHWETHRVYDGACSAAYNTGDPIFNYDVGTSWGYLETPLIDISSSSAPVLSFESWLQTENAPGGASYDWDLAQLFYQTDSGGWVAVAPDINFFQHGEWITLEMDLSAFAGQSSIAFRFLFDSVDGMSNSYEGWYIDDVRVYESAVPVAATSWGKLKALFR